MCEIECPVRIAIADPLWNAVRKPDISFIGILAAWLECRYLDTEVDGSNPDISVLCP